MTLTASPTASGNHSVSRCIDHTIYIDSAGLWVTDGLRMLYEDIVPADGSSNYLNSIDGCLTCTGILFLDVTERS